MCHHDHETDKSDYRYIGFRKRITPGWLECCSRSLCALHISASTSISKESRYL